MRRSPPRRWSSIDSGAAADSGSTATESGAPSIEREPTDEPDNDTSIPSLSPGEAIRFHGSHTSVRFLWPTDEGTPHPFVGVLLGTDGTRYPLYLDRETVTSYCLAPFSVVSTETVPIDPPPHALCSPSMDSPLE